MLVSIFINTYDEETIDLDVKNVATPLDDFLVFRSLPEPYADKGFVELHMTIDNDNVQKMGVLKIEDLEKALAKIKAGERK